MEFMYNADFVITIIESLVALAIIFSIIYKATNVFKLKGFLISTGAIVLIFLAIDVFEKFLDYAYNNDTNLIIIFLGILVIFLLWVIIDCIKINLTSGEEIKREFIRDLKTLGLALLGGVVIVGLIVLSIIK